jgi:transposase-like protein
MIPVAKTTVNVDNEIVQSLLLQGDLTCLQSVVKDLIEHALETKAEEIPAVYGLPAHCRKKMRTTNMTERSNEAIRRRERVIRIFPKDASAMMPAGAYLQDLSEEWISHPSVHGHDGIS